MWYGLFQATVHSQPNRRRKANTLAVIDNRTRSSFYCQILMHSAMYATAPQELELRFGGPDIIVNNYINKLQQLRMPSMQYTQLFMDFSSFICNLVEMFQTFGVTKDLNSSIFSSSQQRNSKRQSNNHRGNQPQTHADRFSENTKRLEKRRTPCAFSDLDYHPHSVLSIKI